jgi:hypothetical protein
MELTSLGDDAVQNLQGDVVRDCQISRISGRTHPTERAKTKGENITGQGKELQGPIKSYRLPTGVSCYRIGA